MPDKKEQGSIELEANAEKPVRLRASVIIAAAASIFAVVVLTVTFALSQPRHRQSGQEYETVVADVSASTNEPLSLLPRDYDQIPESSEAERAPEHVPLQLDPAYGREQEEEDISEEKALGSDVFFDHQNGVPKRAQTTLKTRVSQSDEGMGEGSGYMQDLPADDRQNLQDQKHAFLNQFNGQNDFILDDRLHKPVSAYEIKAGTLIPAVLITGINSDLPGDVIAQVSEHIYDSVTGRFLLVPQGTKLYGRYDSVISYGQERVLVAWQRLILPNGKSIALKGMIAADTAGMSGLEDQVDHHFMRLAGAVMLSTAISLSGNLADENDDSIADDVGDTVAQEASRVGQKYVSKAMNVQPTIKIRGGAEVRVFVNKDMVLEPYKEQ
ncbi:MAG: TrbI/VirB10 family protein [Alphaproteobacteria bacterium]